MTDTLTFDETGPLDYDADLDEHRSRPMSIPLLNRTDAIVIVGYLDDPSPPDFGDAIRNLLQCDRSTLLAASDDLFRYYNDMKSMVDDDQIPAITRPEDTWDHVALRPGGVIKQQPSATKRVLINRIRLRLGARAWTPSRASRWSFCSKLGPYDGHLTNADAYGDPTLESVVFRGFR